MSDVTEDNPLPAGWCIARLGDVIEPARLARPEDEPERVFNYVDISSVDNTAYVISSVEQVKGRVAPSRARRSIRPGDVIFSNVRTYLRNVAMVGTDPPADLCSTGFTVLRPSAALDGRYLFRYVLTREFIDRVTPEQTGTHYPATNERTVLDQTIPVAPLAEQRRIADALDAVYARVAEIRTQIGNAARAVTQLRKAVLSSACSGELTAGWRQRKGIEWEEVEREDGVAHPSSWTCKPSAEVVEPGTVISYGIVQPGPNVPDGVPYVRGLDMDDSGTIKVEQLLRTTSEIAGKHARTELKEGDILLNVIRNLRVAIVPKSLEGGNLTQGTVRMRPSSEVLGPYLARYLASPQAQAWMKQRYVGTDMPRINVEQAREIPIPLPPIEEQQEIVRRVDELLSRAKDAQAEIDAVESRVASIGFAFLSKAFKGELVPTEARLAEQQKREFELAATLVERVKAEIANRPPEPKAQPRRTTRMAKLSKESVVAAIEEMPTAGFSFSELSEKLPADYDALKDVLFDLLDEKDSGLTQYFDKKEKQMRFRRRVS